MEGCLFGGITTGVCSDCPHEVGEAPPRLIGLVSEMSWVCVHVVMPRGILPTPGNLHHLRWSAASEPGGCNLTVLGH